MESTGASEMSSASSSARLQLPPSPIPVHMFLVYRTYVQKSSIRTKKHGAPKHHPSPTPTPPSQSPSLTSVEPSLDGHCIVMHPNVYLCAMPERVKAVVAGANGYAGMTL